MILDTNALSALAEKDDQLIEQIMSAPRLYVTLISLGEYQYGINVSRKQKELTRWLTLLLEKVEVLSPGMDTLPHYADIRRELKTAGTPIPANDCWIAALVRQHKMKIVSRDHHFDRVKGVRRLDW
ncbi:MAG: PIN domain-containing protein [Verrucomicrobia bacterium]|nr:PIN domain-containing protein [Verrucomicrobiota bacterium]MDA1065056.1 PIN domain-containing protein [Verrucomicrobiota bacterium]